MSDGAAFFYHDDNLKYKFNDHHPFNQKRLVLTQDLLREAGALSADALRPARVATQEELLWIHTPQYVEAVQALSVPHPMAQSVHDADRFGLASEDTPYFVGMHEATSQIVGGSIEAADWVMSGKGAHALHLGGGLHHALANRAAGFCVYNDAAVAISFIRRRYKAKVMYIDTDVHHGDGVQWAFYTDPDVMTLSIHETGKYLFPGTGAVNERGEAEGFGANVNIPLEPYTEDESWLDCFTDVVERAVAFFRPDVIVSQHGCDAHLYDPLAHVCCSMDIYAAMPKRIHELAHRYCGGRWVALGGGGYDIWRVVPRAWSLLWLEMSSHPLASALAADPLTALPAAWVKRWQRESEMRLPNTWQDDKNAWTPMPRREQIMQKNEQTKQLALMYIG